MGCLENVETKDNFINFIYEDLTKEDINWLRYKRGQIRKYKRIWENLDGNYENEETKNSKDYDLIKGTKLEKEFIINSNISINQNFWFDSNLSNDCEILERAFGKVTMKKSFKIESIEKFFSQYDDLEEWIIISPRKKRKGKFTKN